jgi:naphthoate synthase
MDELTDVRYEVEAGLAWVIIDRPGRMNAFRARTVDELIRCFKRAWASSEVGVVCLTGAGERAFCTGGDQKQRAETGDYGPSESGLFEIEYLHRLIRELPKPVIAAVNGYAIGGGHVLHVLCDLTIAAETAVFGRPVLASARSTPASAPPTSRGSSERSAPGRSGSSAAATTPRRPNAGDW